MRRLGDLGEIAGFELRHAAAAGIDDLRLDAVAGEHGLHRLADARVVVVDETGRVEHRLAPGGGRGRVDRRRVAAGAHHKGAAVIFRQRGVAVDIGDLFEIGRVSRLSRSLPQFASGATKPRERAVAVGLAEFAARPAHAPFLVLDRAVAQHDMREIEIEFVRRHIGALRHEAHVAQRAGIGDLLVIADRHPVELAGR